MKKQTDELHSLADKLRNWFDSPEGKAHLEKEKAKNTIVNANREIRTRKFEAYLEKHGFQVVLDRLISEHGEAWDDKCWKRGYETYPNNKFNFLWNYIEENYEPVQNGLIPQDFLGSSYFFKGYWFCIYCGQGCFFRVYNNELENILQI
jgi:hypothetical protein